MNNEIKIEDIIKSLRVCANASSCAGCVMDLLDIKRNCVSKLESLAADRLEQLNTFDNTQSAKLLARFGATSCERQVMQRAINTYGM